MEARLDLQGHELLKEQLARIWDLHLADVLTRIAKSAMILAFTEVGFAEETALPADVDTVAIGHIKETLFKEPGGAV